MDAKTELKMALSAIYEWLDENKIGSTDDKKEMIQWEILRCVYKHSIEPAVISEMKKKLRNTCFTITSGDLFGNLLAYFDGNEKYVAFFKDISELTPSGLNTSPNACCGKFELLYRLLRPNSIQPKRGDIVDNGEKIEIKGSDVRISDTELTGIDYKKNCTKIFEGLIEGNTVSKGGLKGTSVYEIEKEQYKHHYEKEFAKNIALSKQLLQTYFHDNGWACSDVEIERIFKNDAWDQDTMKKIILEKMFIKYKVKMEFDKMYIFGDGTDVKIIGSVEDLDKIKIKADYFRINQTANVGWYIE